MAAPSGRPSWPRTITRSPALTPLLISVMPLADAPSVTGVLCALSSSSPATMTKISSPSRTIATVGMTITFVSAIGDDRRRCTGWPAARCVGALNLMRTSAVALAGSTAAGALITVPFSGSTPAALSIRTGRPRLTCPRSPTVTAATTSRRAGSITRTTVPPVSTRSPAPCQRFAMIPGKRAFTTARSCRTYAASTAACACLSAASACASSSAAAS